MTTSEIIIALTIHLIIPLTGLVFYLRLVRKMKREKIANPPTIDLFFIFATYGGLLLMILTTLIWDWSGMASLGALYLIIGAPVVMGIIAYRNNKTRQTSKYHIWTYRLGLLYYIIAPLTILTAIIFE